MRRALRACIECGGFGHERRDHLPAWHVWDPDAGGEDDFHPPIRAASREEAVRRWKQDPDYRGIACETAVYVGLAGDDDEPRPVRLTDEPMETGRFASTGQVHDLHFTWTPRTALTSQALGATWPAAPSQLRAPPPPAVPPPSSGSCAHRWERQSGPGDFAYCAQCREPAPPILDLLRENAAIRETLALRSVPQTCPCRWRMEDGPYNRARCASCQGASRPILELLRENALLRKALARASRRECA